jgi:hypothetical protein
MAFLDHFSWAGEYAIKANHKERVPLKFSQREDRNDELFSIMQQLKKILYDISYDNLQRMVASTFVE